MSTDPQLAEEFVKFLNTQLKECREQLQVAIEENAVLRQEIAAIRAAQDGRVGQERQLEVGGSSDPSALRSDAQETVDYLEAELEQLKEELTAAREEAEARAEDAIQWRMRYDASQSSVVERDSDIKKKKAMEHLYETMCSSLMDSIGPKTTIIDSAKEYTDFQAFMTELSGSLTNQIDASESRVVFELPKLQILSKAARNACDDRFGFYGNLLQWCTSPSQNALLLCPEYLYGGGGIEGAQQWADATEWSSLVGTRLELFDTDGERLVYAGTFLIHKGPVCCGLQNLPNTGDGVVEQLAQRTFNPASKSQRHKAKTYLPVLREMYKKGEATLQVLGLQRVGFNTKFFEILRRAYVKRGKTRARARSETARSNCFWILW
ncbi:hypothetical protein ACG7TL_008472 [Trametes sanguinea]